MTQPEQVPVVYPVGHHACGKSQASSHLVNEHGFAIIETGAMVRAAYKVADPDKTRYGHIGQFAQEVERGNPDFFIDMVLTELHDKSDNEAPNGIIVNGMRTLSHLQRIQSRIPATRQAVVWIESPRDILKQRWELREGRTLSDQQFDGMLQFDSNLGLEEIRAAAHADILNDDSIDTLNCRVEKALHRLGIMATSNCIERA